jgi:hypothetical protein
MTSDTGLPSIFPACGILAAVVGQQTASGISLIGVKATPAWPVDNLTPAKKYRSLSHQSNMFWRGTRDFSFNTSMVSVITDNIAKSSKLKAQRYKLSAIGSYS